LSIGAVGSAARLHPRVASRLYSKFDFEAATALVRPLTFEHSAETFFGAPPAESKPLILGGFSGSVARGASCNCHRVMIAPHCHGTHTESVGHLTLTQPKLAELLPLAPLPALLLTVTTAPAPISDEDSDPAPRPGDRLITRKGLLKAWPDALPFEPKALLIRSRGTADPANPPFLTRQATEEIIARDISHLVLDLPSIDRTVDGGKLTAHRVFFGLPTGSTDLNDATRAHATLTELAQFPSSVIDGPCGLMIQIPAWQGDAAPSRPIHLPLKKRRR
jgi:arylformamidase